jgi:hypothetical protein
LKIRRLYELEGWVENAVEGKPELLLGVICVIEYLTEIVFYSTFIN